MKGYLLLIIAVVLFTEPAMALNIRRSKHDLGVIDYYTYKLGVEANICIFCHAPHNPTKGIPLWNKNSPAGSDFTFYTSSRTIRRTRNALSPDSISLFCLSCHDGATAPNAFSNVPSRPVIIDPVRNLVRSMTNVDLSSNSSFHRDHPIHFDYDRVTYNVPLFEPRHNVAGIKFFNVSQRDGTRDDGYIECASCHEPHGAGFTKFLRKDNSASSLCLSCHIK